MLEDYETHAPWSPETQAAAIYTTWLCSGSMDEEADKKLLADALRDREEKATKREQERCAKLLEQRGQYASASRIRNGEV